MIAPFNPQKAPGRSWPPCTSCSQTPPPPVPAPGPPGRVPGWALPSPAPVAGHPAFATLPLRRGRGTPGAARSPLHSRCSSSKLPGLGRGSSRRGLRRGDAPVGARPSVFPMAVPSAGRGRASPAADAAPLATRCGRRPPPSGSPVPDASTWSSASPSQAVLPPRSPRHSPVISLGAAILSDGSAAASRRALSVAAGAILEPGNRSFRRPDLPWTGLGPID